MSNQKKLNENLFLSASLVGATGTLQNITASYALNAGTASVVLGVISTASLALNAVSAQTASLALNAVTSSYAQTASLVISTSYAQTASIANYFSASYISGGAAFLPNIYGPPGGTWEFDIGTTGSIAMSDPDGTVLLEVIAGPTPSVEVSAAGPSGPGFFVVQSPTKTIIEGPFTASGVGAQFGLPLGGIDNTPVVIYGDLNLSGTIHELAVNVNTTEVAALNPTASTVFYSIPVVSEYSFIDPGTGSTAVNVLLPTGSVGMYYWIQNVNTASLNLIVNSASVVQATLPPSWWGEFWWTTDNLWRTTSGSSTVTALTASYGSGSFFAVAALSSSYALTASNVAGTATITGSFQSTGATYLSGSVYIVSGNHATLASSSAVLNVGGSGSQGSTVVAIRSNASGTQTPSFINFETNEGLLGQINAIENRINFFGAPGQTVAISANGAFNSPGMRFDLGNNVFFISAIFPQGFFGTGSFQQTGSSTFFGPVTSSQGFSGSGLAITGVVTSSYAVTASFALNGGGGGGGGGTTIVSNPPAAVFTQFPFDATYGATFLINPVPTGLTEIDQSIRMLIDAKNAVSASVACHITASGNSGSWLTAQYSTDEINWTSFSSLSLMNAGTSMSIYSPFPPTASTQIMVRLVTTNGDGATNAEIGNVALGLIQNAAVSAATASYALTSSYSQFVSIITSSNGLASTLLTSSMIINPGWSNSYILLDANTASLSVNLPSHSLNQIFNIRNVGVSGALCIADNNNVTQSMAGQPAILYGGMYMTFLDTGLAWVIY